VIAEGFGWRAVFLALAPLPILTGLLAFPQLRVMPAGTPAPDGRSRMISALVLAGGAGLFLAGLGNGQLLPALAMVTLGLLLLVPALRCLLPPGTLRAAPGLPATIATMGVLNLAFFGVDVFVPLTLVEVRGATVAVAGVALTAATMAWSIGSWVQARTAEQISRRVMTRAGVALLAFSFLLMVAILSPAVPLPVGIVGWGIAGLGMGLAYTTLSLAMLELAEPGQEGEGSASLNLAAVLGSGFGAGIGGAFVALLSEEGASLSRALLVQDWVMLGVAALAFVAAQGLPGMPARKTK
jgi:MFS family permease